MIVDDDGLGSRRPTANISKPFIRLDESPAMRTRRRGPGAQPSSSASPVSHKGTIEVQPDPLGQGALRLRWMSAPGAADDRARVALHGGASPTGMDLVDAQAVAARNLKHQSRHTNHIAAVRNSALGPQQAWLRRGIAASSTNSAASGNRM